MQRNEIRSFIWPVFVLYKSVTYFRGSFVTDLEVPGSSVGSTVDDDQTGKCSI